MGTGGKAETAYLPPLYVAAKGVSHNLDKRTCFWPGSAFSGQMPEGSGAGTMRFYVFLSGSAGGRNLFYARSSFLERESGTERQIRRHHR
jgi:hypothetical protein